MTLNEILATNGKTVSDITKIYHGKDNWCRCGCGGNYFTPGESGFTRAVKAMNKASFVCHDVEIEPNYINIPTSGMNKCYCIYLD